MTQPEHFTEAMNNKLFSGRGFIQRFLFAFPESKAGKLHTVQLGDIHTAFIFR